MGGTAYIALSGLRTQFEQLDRLAGDLANTQSAGYKSERASMETAARPAFEKVLQTAVDVRSARSKTDFRGGEIVPTGRDLDVALDGSGFFVVGDAGAERYTRAGHFLRGADGTLTTPDGAPVLGEGGPIKLGPEHGHLRAPTAPSGRRKAVVGRLRIVEFDDTGSLTRAGHTQFASSATPRDAADTAVHGGALERSNVELVDRLAELTAVSRNFEALQRGVSLLMNDMDGRVIGELARK